MHSFPLFYCCYLLKSESTRNTYVGSTNNPLKRLRQHNGEIASGAHKTERGRPWNIVCFVYGFPSVVSALQFEWAWQNPNITHKVQENERTQFNAHKNDNTTKNTQSRKHGVRTSLTMRVRVLYNMLTMNAWKNWPLKVKIFDQRVWKLWETLHCSVDIKIPQWIIVELDILLDSRKNTKQNTNLNANISVNTAEKGSVSNCGKVEDKRYSALKKIDLNQDEMSKTAFEILEKIKKNDANLCIFCKNSCDLPELNSENAALKYSQLIICPTKNCLHVFHLLCLARWKLDSETENSVLINSYKCLFCKKDIIWGDCIRLQYCILRKINTNIDDTETLND
ncbi:hypothetical protein PORY_001162 [Pneumocystis oryctolagi]|uniref:Uncharacterized protein n=1 Tax=Pneumocystis oryctolagi TaxID=42067 RepID=A0ACB7CDH1_9ASCO|nr:hypothetical protein PORY_001162 [Pneumocystis oryctolagi]